MFNVRIVARLRATQRPHAPLFWVKFRAVCGKICNFGVEKGGREIPPEGYEKTTPWNITTSGTGGARCVPLQSRQ